MYDKKETYRNYYSHSKINDYKYYVTNSYESPREKTYITAIENLNLKKKSKSDLHHPINPYFKPKLNNLTIATIKQKHTHYKT